MYSVHKSAKFQPQGAADIPRYKFVEILQRIDSEKLEHGINYALIISRYSSVSSSTLSLLKVRLQMCTGSPKFDPILYVI